MEPECRRRAEFDYPGAVRRSVPYGRMEGTAKSDSPAFYRQKATMAGDMELATTRNPLLWKWAGWCPHHRKSVIGAMAGLTGASPSGCG